MAGFGGQGVLFMGRLLAYAGMRAGRNVTWIPSYGAEMRGGTANCTVVIADEIIASPVAPRPHIVIAMNPPSLRKFEPTVRPGGLLFINSSLVHVESERKDIRTIKVPANDLAEELGAGRVANMIMMGALLAETKIIPMDAMKNALPNVISGRHLDLLNLNVEALERGAKFAAGDR
ncbi:MAG: 2-oxoacid:acceptor oxidoreductase family protein [bacterium]